MDVPAGAEVLAILDGVPSQWRTATDLYYLDAAGQVASRPLDPVEVAAVVEEAVAVAVETVRRTVEQRADKALGDLSTLIAGTTNATINAGPAPYIKTLARVLRLVLRLLLRRFDAAE